MSAVDRLIEDYLFDNHKKLNDKINLYNDMYDKFTDKIALALKSKNHIAISHLIVEYDTILIVVMDEIKSNYNDFKNKLNEFKIKFAREWSMINSYHHKAFDKLDIDMTLYFSRFNEFNKIMDDIKIKRPLAIVMRF